MRVRLLYFAGVRDALGPTEEELQLPPDVRTVGGLSDWLEASRPALRGRLTTVRFAVNESFANAEDALSDDDVIALIPPVAGG